MRKDADNGYEGVPVAGRRGERGGRRGMHRRKAFRILLYSAGILLLVAIAGYFVAGAVIRRKLDAAVRNLPASMTIRYGSLRSNVFAGSLEIGSVDFRYEPSPSHSHRLSIKDLKVSGFSVITWLRYHRLRINEIRLNGITVDLDGDLLEKDSMPRRPAGLADSAFIRRIELDSISVEATRKGSQLFSLQGNIRLDSVTQDTVGDVRLSLREAHYAIPGMDETVDCRQIQIDSKQGSLRMDTLRVRPDLDPEEIGRLKGHQVDVLRGQLADIRVEGLDVPGLLKHRLHADQLNLGRGIVHVFRDRRLPLKPGEKMMPMEDLGNLSMDLRVKRVRLESTRFEYEEFPKVGNTIGRLVIDDFHGTVEPLVNRPRAGDPAFITVTTSGSLMGSGTVTATTRMPLHKHAYYEVEGAFHDLDVTKLNDPAENLGQLHLESGMLNFLGFQFEMGDERATGKIIGEYHDLVADKLKFSGGRLKTAKFKSFALKKLIIPRNKDRSLPVSKRTGKVDYKRDKQRYFSYYLLHSLLVGVKSSFSLGFLLPG